MMKQPTSKHYLATEDLWLGAIPARSATSLLNIATLIIVVCVQ